MKKITGVDLKSMKEKKEKIVALTAYDYVTAIMLNKASVHLILVGDSLGMVMLGYNSTLPVSMEEMLHHTKAVSRGNSTSLLVADMPFMSYHLSVEQTVENAGRFIKDAGADAVKIEGGKSVIDKVEALVKTGIPVMGHIGLTPQQLLNFGGYKVQGREPKRAKELIEDAKFLDKAGAFAIVLECVPMDLAKEITNEVSIPTIGIGAGKFCDGQILVIHDLLGISTGLSKPKFVKKYTDLSKVVVDAVSKYKQEVESGEFPSEEYTYT